MTDTALPRPSLLRRLIAIIYDGLLIIPLIMAITAGAMGVRSLLGSAADELLPPAIVQSITIICCVGFYAIFWLKSGQTLGMQAWRIKLVPMAGNELSFGRAVTRCGAAVLSLGCFGLGYLWCLVDKNKRCWHDYLSGTELELLPRKSRVSDTPK